MIVTTRPSRGPRPWNLWLAGLCLFTLLPGLAPMAQEASEEGSAEPAAEPTATPESSEEAFLEEITVTATKRDEVAQDVGLSLTAVDDEILEREGIDSFADLATRVAGLAFGERGPGQSLVVLRGVNSSTTQFNTDEPESKETVGIYFDETPVSLNGYNPDPRLFDMERVEVLRGPQGTLFGSGSLSGTIRYLSKPPDPSAFDGKVSTSISTTRGGGTNFDVNAMLNQPLSDRAALRFTGYSRTQDGFIDNLAPQIDPRHPFFGQTGPLSTEPFEDVNTEDTWGGRLQLAFEKAGQWKTLFRLYHQTTRTGGYPTEDTFAPAEPIPGNNPGDALLGDFQQSRLFAERSQDEFTLFSADLRFDLGAAELVSVTSLLERDLDQNFESTDILPVLVSFGVLPFAIDYETPLPQVLNNVTRSEDFIQELRLVSTGEGRWSWLVGAFFHQQDKSFAQDAPSPGLDAVIGIPIGNNVFQSFQTFDDQQLAIFGEVSVELAPRWRAIAGLRWFDFEQDMEFDSIGGLFSAGLDVRSSLREDGINPRLSLEYRPRDDHLWYATAAEGFRLGGTNDPIPPICGLGSSGESFSSDSLINYELGYKGSWARRLRLNGAAYLIDWDDVPVADSRACGFAVTRNAGRVETQGLELDLTAALSAVFDLSLSVSYTDAQFTERFSSEDGSFLVLGGTETPLTPELSWGLRATYRFPVTFGQTAAAGYLNATWSHIGERYNNANVLSRVEMEAYDLVGLQLGLEGERWRLGLFADNLLDERAVLFKDNIFLLHNRDTVNRPRTVGVTLSWNL